MIVVRVIGSSAGLEEGENADIRADSEFLVAGSVGRAASRSGGRSLGVALANDACRAFA